jgi:ribonucleotide reductase alpha subunit
LDAGDELIEVNPLFLEVAKREGFYSDELMRQVARQGSVHGVAGIPERWQEVFVTSHEIEPEFHVKMQAIFQEHTDNAVSKTVNFPNAATMEDVKNVYMLAYKLGCKGITIYRDGSRDAQVLNVGSIGEKTTPRQMPEGDHGIKKEVVRKSDFEKMAAQAGQPNLMDLLSQQATNNKQQTTNDKQQSIINNKQKITDEKQPKNEKCPECGQMMEIKEGCMTCPVCGWGKCSLG